MQRMVFPGLNLEIQAGEVRQPVCVSLWEWSLLLCYWTQHNKVFVAVTATSLFPWKPDVDAGVTGLASSESEPVHLIGQPRSHAHLTPTSHPHRRPENTYFAFQGYRMKPRRTEF